MTLKINYLDKKKSSIKTRLFLYIPNIKTSILKAKLNEKSNQKIENLIKKNKIIKESK